MPPPPTSTETPSKVKTTLVFLVIAMAMLFLLRTLYIRVKHDSSTIYLVVTVYIITFLCFYYGRNPDQIPHQPLFSFPSLSRPSPDRPLEGTIVDLPEPTVSMPSSVPPHLELHTVYDGRSADGVVWERGEPSGGNSSEYWERGEPSGRISTEYWEKEEPSGRIPNEYWERQEPPVRNLTECREPETSNLSNEPDDDDQGSNGTLDDMWHSIVATGKAKPVKLFTSSQREGNPKSRSTKGAIGISSDELTHLADTFIRKHHNNLRMERQESNQRRLAKRLGFRDYRNAVSV